MQDLFNHLWLEDFKLSDYHQINEEYLSGQSKINLNSLGVILKALVRILVLIKKFLQLILLKKSYDMKDVRKFIINTTKLTLIERIIYTAC